MSNLTSGFDTLCVLASSEAVQWIMFSKLSNDVTLGNSFGSTSELETTRRDSGLDTNAKMWFPAGMDLGYLCVPAACLHPG